MAINNSRLLHLASTQGKCKAYFQDKYKNGEPSLKQLHLDTNEIQDPILRFICTFTIMGDVMEISEEDAFAVLVKEIINKFLNDEISYNDLETLRVDYLNHVLNKINLVESV